MKIKGRCHKYGDDINTDVIIPGKYTKTLNIQDLIDHCMEDLDPEFSKKVVEGDMLVAGENFGIGSSREQAPLSLKYSGISTVVAKSFARIFYRNAINVGLNVVICDTSYIKDGSELEIDMEEGNIAIDGEKQIECQLLPQFMRNILSIGGLAPFLKEKGDFFSK